MSAPVLMVIFDAVYLVALAAWVGGALFFVFGVAPLLRTVLGAEAGGRFERALLPRFSLWGAVAGSVALPAAVAVPLAFPELRGPRVGAQAVVILAATLVMLYAGSVLGPALDAAHDAGPDGHARLERLRRRSLRLNLLVLALGVGLLVAFAARPAPRTAGIVERDPARTTGTD